MANNAVVRRSKMAGRGPKHGLETLSIGRPFVQGSDRRFLERLGPQSAQRSQRL
jgi:hypothetical protein